MSSLRHTSWAAPMLVVAAALAVLSASVPAAATQGSIPEEVAAYAADPSGLVASLDDLVGVDASGQGIEFGDGTAVGPLHRIFSFTEGWLAGEPSDPAVELRNEWAAPITIDQKPLGVAIIWINPSSVTPELADFLQDVTMTTLIQDAAADAYLVSDDPRGAWFALVGDDLTVIEAGTSGVDATTSLSAYHSVVAAQPTATAASADTGSAALPAVLIAGAVVVVVGSTIAVRRRNRADSL